MQMLLRLDSASLHGRQGCHQLRFQPLSVTVAQFQVAMLRCEPAAGAPRPQKYLDLDVQGEWLLSQYQHSSACAVSAELLLQSELLHVPGHRHRIYLCFVHRFLLQT